MKKLLALLALLVAPAVGAQPTSAYYGLSLGELDYSEPAPPFGTERFEDTVSTWRLMVGYQFMKHLAVEGSYGESSTIRDTASFGSGLGAVELGFETELNKMLTIRILGTFPFDNGLALMAGLAYVDFEQQLALSVDGAPVVSGEFSDNRPAYYAGVGYNWERFGIRLGYEKFDFEDEVDAEEVSVGFFYRL